MAEITLSKAVRSNLLNLQSTASMLSKSQERLSSGLRVNSALDNPTNFFTAQGLNSRASDLSQLADAVSNAVQTVAAADKGITAITKLVESAQATARQALQTAETTGGSGPSSVAGTVAIGADSTASVSGGNDISSSDIYAVAGINNYLTLDVGGTQVTFHFYNSAGPTTSPDPGTLGIDTDDGGNPKALALGLAEMQTALRASGVAGTADATVGLNGGGELEITLGTNTTQSLTVVSDATSGIGFPTGFGFTDGQTSSPNAVLSGLNGTLTVGSNTLTFGAGGIDSRAELVTALSGLGGGITGSIDGSNHLTFSGSSGFTVGGTLDVNSAFGIAEQSYGSAPNPKRAELVATYNDLLGQIDALAKDSGFNGVNLLNGDNLSVLFNEDGSSKLDIAGVTNTAASLGLTSLSSTAFNTNTSINSTLDGLKGAIETLRSQSAKFGSNLSVVETRQDFTKNMVNVLQTGASNLTLADTNEEAANVLALQTRQQLSSTALSLASQADQNVLRLF
ncbi:MAG: flagellar protein [Devosia sp.]|uniref:flagellin N-terminal helical domain-containing protein n=1 Tax=Devosia sp. TaxID=1871048 RepID=UPI001A551F26|nr:flagellin [Devosia sp.]MBL8596836.1 flagellar protein [Devosia sp.]